MRNGQLEYFAKQTRNEADLKGYISLHNCTVRYIGSMQFVNNNGAAIEDEDSDDETGVNHLESNSSVSLAGRAVTGDDDTSGKKKNLSDLSSYMYKISVSDEQRALNMAARSPQEAKAWVQAISNCINVENYLHSCDNHTDTRPLLPIVLLLSKGDDDDLTAHVDSTKLELRGVEPFTIYTMKTMIDSVLYNRSLNSLQTLVISKCHINDDFIKVLSEALSINKTITHLDLSENRIGDAGCSYLCDCLLINTEVTTLNMSANEFSDSGVVFISDLLMSNISVTTLNMSNNNITKDGILALSKTLASNSTLTDLNLSHSDMDDTAASYMAKGLKNNKSLLKLGLSHCSITSAGMDALCKHGILLNKTLRDLDLRGNTFDKEGANALIVALKDHKSLVRVDCGDNLQLGVDGITVLAQTLKSRFLISKLVMTRNK
jgi:Ran GTPase-activating protein (RanGAP) involved in mRNA processing and transport